MATKAGDDITRGRLAPQQRRHRDEAELLLLLDPTLRSDLRRLGHHVDLVEMHPTETDGYKANHGYDGTGSGAKWTVVEGGQTITVDATNTEAAAIKRTAYAQLDEHTRHVIRASRHRAEMVAAWANMVYSLKLADQARDNTEVPDEKTCSSCRRIGVSNPADHWGNVAGNLKDSMWTCAQCYTFAYRNGRLPTADEMAHHQKTGRWRLKAS